MARWQAIWLCALAVVCGWTTAARCQTSTQATTGDTNAVAFTRDDSIDNTLPAIHERILSAFPSAIGEGLDITGWGWLAGTHTDNEDAHNYFDAELGLAITKTFDQRVSISAQGNFIDANKDARGELEQAYVSVLLNQDLGAFITIGKFNANFGVEARDFWSRSTGTTSVLFGAQPQDLIGAMVTLPVFDTGVTLRPFISEDFQGGWDFNQSPSGGFQAEYQPFHGFSVALTSWVGPGFVMFGGRHIHEPYGRGAYGSLVTANWQGPNLDAQRGGTLYFEELKVTWQVLHDLRISAEGLGGTSGTSLGRWGWSGVMAQVDYDLTDKWRVFGRISYLDDQNWLVTGNFQCIYEYSFGSAYELLDGVELRGEYRHDKSNATGDVNSFSIHLALTF